MKNQLYVGLGIGLIAYPAMDILRNLPLIGRYVMYIVLVVGVVFLVKGFMR